MKSLYDLVSLVLFAGVAILFLQRSAQSKPDSVALWKYAVAAIACAVADVMGNHGLLIPALLTFAGLIAFSLIMLKPFRSD